MWKGRSSRLKKRRPSVYTDSRERPSTEKARPLSSSRDVTVRPSTGVIRVRNPRAFAEAEVRRSLRPQAVRPPQRRPAARPARTLRPRTRRVRRTARAPARGDPSSEPDPPLGGTDAVTKLGRCKLCGGEFQQARTGRPRRYCSDAHKQAADRDRRKPMSPGEWRELARGAIDKAKRTRLERAGGYAAIERDERQAA